MSRIHEALKKAEQERAALQGGPAQPTLETGRRRSVRGGWQGRTVYPRCRTDAGCE